MRPHCRSPWSPIPTGFAADISVGETGVWAMADPRAWWAAVRSGRWLTDHSDPDGVGVGE